IMW
ncbi:hypothetical protein VCHENC02_3285B, partial [Vibrio harveyi]